MPTFLQLCEQLREEVGVQGVISAVTGQTGMHLRLINYIVKADKKIQRRKVNWKFLWNTWSYNLDTTTGEILPPSGLGMFDQGSFQVDGFPVDYVDYKQYRDVYRYDDTPGQPSYATIQPNGNLVVFPPPDGSYTLTAEYWRDPVPLVNPGQYSLIPERFHDVIVAQAKIYYAEKNHDTGLYQSAFIEHEDTYREMKAHCLPGTEDDNKSQSSMSHVIEVI